jgi:lipid-A-disaccharide synthase
VYKTSPISYFLAKMLIKVKYISLVNLIAEGAVVTELIQKEYHLKRVIEELSKIQPESLTRKRQLLDYDALAVKMGKSGASKITAELMLGYLKSGRKRA